MLRQGAVRAFEARVVSSSQHDCESFRQQLTTCLEPDAAIRTRHERDTAFTVTHP